MRWLIGSCTLVATLFVFTGCRQAPRAADPAQTADAPGIDQRSYDLGVIGAFSEVVQMGVKRLALSAALTPEEMAALLADARAITDRHSVRMFHETDFLITDLFPESLTDGKEVLLIYSDPGQGRVRRDSC